MLGSDLGGGSTAWFRVRPSWICWKFLRNVSPPGACMMLLGSPASAGSSSSFSEPEYLKNKPKLWCMHMCSNFRIFYGVGISETTPHAEKLVTFNELDFRAQLIYKISSIPDPPPIFESAPENHSILQFGKRCERLKTSLQNLFSYFLSSTKT